MSKPVKYFLIAAVSFCILVVVAIFTITSLVDVNRYKPQIEQFVTEKTGYPLTLGGKISLSLFPWVGLSFTDFQLGNPKGFVNKTFVHVDDFQAQVKVLPLLSKKVEISKFILKKPEIFLEKSPKGVWNWQKLTEGNKPSTASASEKTMSAGKATAPVGSTAGKTSPQGIPAAQKTGGFALQSLAVGEFSITDGLIEVNDLQNKQKREVSDFTLQLTDVSLDQPINMTMSAMLDGKPLGLKGTVGPLGQDFGKGKINLDLKIQAFDTLNAQTNGYLEDINTKKAYKLTVNVEPFNLKQLFSNLKLSFPVTTTDPKAFGKVGLKANIAGDTTQVVLSQSNITLDDTSINLDATAKDFSRPDLAFNISADSIDLDRYLPPAAPEGKAVSEPSRKEANQEPVKASGTAPAPASGNMPPAQVKQSSGIDYSPLRKLVLKGALKLGKVKVHGGTVTNVALDVTGRDGLFTLNSLGLDLYEGKIAANGKLNVQKNVPATELNLTLQNVQAGPLLKDFAHKDIIEGVLKAEVAVNMKGDNGDLIKQSLNGKGDLLFKDGALIGLDLAQMARTIESGFTLEQQGERPKTDFAELHAPFSITNGLVHTPDTTLVSPFLRVSVTGDANLVNEALALKVKPTIVGTIKGQGDEEKRGGLTVPILVGGTFNAPKFKPDLESFAKGQMPTKEELGEIIKTGKIPPERKEQLKKDVEQAKGLLKGLFGK